MDYYVVKFHSPPTQTEPNPDHEMVLRASGAEDAQRRAPVLLPTKTGHLI